MRQLPEKLQAEVLDFAEYLLAKAQQEQPRQEDREWSALSMALALRGMEEEEPNYNVEDLKERFS